MEKEKKTKLTLKNFKGNIKKTAESPTKDKTSFSKPNPFQQKDRAPSQKSFKPFAPKIISPGPAVTKQETKDWAKKKIQEELQRDFRAKKSLDKKRDTKITISQALSDEDALNKQRSLASVKRAREKLSKKSSEYTSGEGSESVKVKKQVEIPEFITIQNLANRMAEKATALIKYLLTKNIKVTINHSIDADTAEFIVNEFGHIPVRKQFSEDQIIENNQEEVFKDSRPPVVTVMGHVDHGKTSLLDSLRDANVVSGEFGGITQHIGAYQVKVNDQNSITFIDTPGHAAFTEMRARGSKITDIVILVVAANDGIKPQTIEAIQHAKAAKVPIIVAINKCDLPGIDTRKVKNQLLEHELVVEELGGDILCIEISAVKKTNLDKLKEAIILQSELLNLKTSNIGNAKGVVIESKLDKGKGPVSTILVTQGTLKRGDSFISGTARGKVRALYDYNGKLIEEALPSTPVEVVGFDSINNAGDDFLVLNEQNIEEILSHRKDKTKSSVQNNLAANDDIFGDLNKKEVLNFIIKTDVHGSLEALTSSLLKIEDEKVSVKIILSAVGPITETDVSLAKASNAKIVGFNIKPNKEAKELAKNYNLEILFFNIIYEVIDFAKKSLSGLLEPEIKEETLGTCEILEIFDVSKVGKIAGVKVTQGEIKNNADARLIRDGAVIYTAKIGSLFREKNEVKEVKSGLECGVSIKDFQDYKKGDVIEAFTKKKIQRTL